MSSPHHYHRRDSYERPIIVDSTDDARQNAELAEQQRKIAELERRWGWQRWLLLALLVLLVLGGAVWLARR